MSHRTRNKALRVPADRTRPRILVLLPILILAGFSVPATAIPTEETTKISVQEKIVQNSPTSEAKVVSLESLKDSLGQFFVFGLSGPLLDEKTKAHLLETKAGAFILFRRNLQNNKQVTELTAELHKLTLQNTGHPALIGLDQEGGKVVRVPFSPPLPSAFAMGKSRDPQLIEDLSFQLGRALRQLGFNMNFAPVLDLGADDRYSFLGQRAFAADPVWASDLGMAFARGQTRASVLPVAKHFPGIGPVPNDPHLSLVRRSISMEDLRSKDLIPFENFARLPVSGVMISHLIYPKIDPTDTPGTFSKVIVEDLLQKQLSYTGLVVTDDLMMAGAQASKDFQENVIKAFQAGADLMMVSWSELRQKQAVQALWNALKSGRIRSDVIQARLRKIENIKQKIRLDQAPHALNREILLVYNFKAYEQLIDRLFKKSIENADKSIEDIQSGHILVLRGQAALMQGLSNHSAIRQGSAEQISSRLRREAGESIWVLFIRNKKEADFAAGVDKKIRDQILVVNQWRPDLNIGTYPNQLGLFMSHPQSEKLISDWISERVLQSPAQPSGEPRHFGLSPNPDHPKFRWPAELQVASEDPGQP